MNKIFKLVTPSSGGGGGGGDVVGPSVAVDGDVAVFDSTTGKLIKNGNKSVAELLDRANHTGTQTASTISDFDTEVSNNTDVAANTSARHAAVTVTDSGEIDFTLTGQQITASLKNGSIDETKLDTSVNDSLDLADSAIQSADLAAVATSGSYSDLSDKPTTLDDLTPASSLIIGDGIGGWEMVTPASLITDNNIITTTNTKTLTNKTFTDTTNVLGGVTVTLGSDATGDIYYRDASGHLTRLGIGTDGQVLTSTGTLPNWEDPSGGFEDPMTTRGDIIWRALGGTTRLAVGTNGQTLTTDGTDIYWGDVATPLSKAAYTDINTGTDDAKYVTSKGLKDSNYLLESEVKAIKLDDFGTPDDNTTLDVTSTYHGLCPKLPNVATKFLAGDGIYRTPIGGPTYWAVINSPTRTANTTFTCTTTLNTNIDKLVEKGIVVRWTESSTQKVAVIASVSFSTPTLTVTIAGDTMASIDTGSLEYSLLKAEKITWSLAGSIGATGTDVANSNFALGSYRALAFQFYAGTAGSGTTTIDVNDDGTSITSTKASITTTGTKSTMVASTSTIAEDSKLTIDIDAKAATPITDLYCYLFVIPTTLLYKD